MPECNNSHELETLMPPPSQESGQPVAEVPEEQSLMASANLGEGEDASAPELKAIWNGSVSHNWANRITRYRDTITEDSPTLINGALSMLINDKNMDQEDHLCASLCSHQVEAEVIVHTELSDTRKEKDDETTDREQDSTTTGEPSLSKLMYSPFDQSGEEEPFKQPSISKSPLNLPSIKLVAGYSGELQVTGDEPSADVDPQQPAMLTNGFHSPKTMQPTLRSEQLENGDSRHCPSAPGKTTSAGLPPTPFVSSGLVHATSAAHSYLCP